MITTEVSLPTRECPHPERWSMFDDNSAEVEVADFLYSLMLAVKPSLVVETGTHLGLSAKYMAEAIKENGFGKVITCETRECYLDIAYPRLAPLAKWVNVVKGSSLELEVQDPIDILFCDSDPRIRMQEVSHFWDKLHVNSLILIHDVNSGCHNELRQELLGWHDRLSIVMLPTPRGLAICQKR